MLVLRPKYDQEIKDGAKSPGPDADSKTHTCGNGTRCSVVSIGRNVVTKIVRVTTTVDVGKKCIILFHICIAFLILRYLWKGIGYPLLDAFAQSCTSRTVAMHIKGEIVEVSIQELACEEDDTTHIVLPDMFALFLAPSPKINLHYEGIRKESEAWLIGYV